MQDNISGVLKNEYINFQLGLDHFTINSETAKKYSSELTKLLSSEENSQEQTGALNLKQRTVVVLNKHPFIDADILQIVLTFMETNQLKINTDNALKLWFTCKYLTFFPMQLQVEHKLRSYFRTFTNRDLNILKNQLPSLSDFIEHVKLERKVDEIVLFMVSEVMSNVSLSYIIEGNVVNNWAQELDDSSCNFLKRCNCILQSAKQEELFIGEIASDSYKKDSELKIGNLIHSLSPQSIAFFALELLARANLSQLENPDDDDDDDDLNRDIQNLQDKVKVIDQIALFKLILTPTNLPLVYEKTKGSLDSYIDQFFQHQACMLANQEELTKKDLELKAAYEEIKMTL